MSAVAMQLRETSALVYRGLCGTRTHAPSCGFYNGPDSVIQCQQFTLDEAKTLPLPRLRRTPASAESDGGERSFRGICMNCDERERCALRTPGRAVWYCEEYR